MSQPVDRAGALRVACVQLSSPSGESGDERLARVVAQLEEVAPTADLVVLPELWYSGYFSFDRYETDARPLDDELLTTFGEIAARHGIHLLAGTFIERHDAGIANTSVLYGPDGALAHTYRKIHLFGYGSKEATLLTAGERATVADTAIGRVTATTCYDVRFPELYRLLAEQGAQLVVIPAAWPAARREHWRVLLRARAIENQAFVIGCNAGGSQGDVALAGHSAVISPWGEVLAEAGSDAEVLRTEIDLSLVDEVRREFPVLTHRRIAIDGRIATEALPVDGLATGTRPRPRSAQVAG